ncbi:hypothetical protein DL546_000840 [Coniochaeta pulveracea]|uniref:GAR domain-containing protein n=1 Tax=Coniochaeta pulveracea TaxID=177199 RepID=A0A420Y692_9PEZI|nr:hypothetical protein DL546_000840 [Coniochaeta pulveracea]
MNDFPRLSPAMGYRPSHRRQQSRSTSGSPSRQRNTDDLLSQVTPRTVVDVLENASGPLKICMDASTHSEQAFAMRAAVASRNIQEWVEEVRSWPWPTYDTSAGFERPPTKRQDLVPDKSDWSNNVAANEGYDGSFLGSLPATEVERYESRIASITRDLQGIDIEEIKSHVLHNHIMPLSRPGTPASDFLRSEMLSSTSYAHMSDFTALVTSTVLQILPNLSRLKRLLATWTVRLVVLRRSSAFLDALGDAETALKAGWKAMEVESSDERDSYASSSSVLSRQDFQMIKMVVERKVASAGQHLDYMLDALEGREDTLPEAWIDRVDALESGYAEWVAACEMKIREAHWTETVRGTGTAENGSSCDDKRQSSARFQGQGSPVSAESHEDNQDTRLSDSAQKAVSTNKGSSSQRRPPEVIEHQRGTAALSSDVDEHSTTSASARKSSSPPPVILVHPAEDDAFDSAQHVQEEPVMLTTDTMPTASGDSPRLESQTEAMDLDLGRFDGLKDATAPSDAPSTPPTPDQAFEDISTSQTQVLDGDIRSSLSEDLSLINKSPSSFIEQIEDPETYTAYDCRPESDIDFVDGSDLPEPELPMLPRERRESTISNTSTIIHGPLDDFDAFSGDSPDHGTPDHRQMRGPPLLQSEPSGDVILPSVEHDDTDMPSSPPDFRSTTRSFSVSFNEIPTVHEVPEEDSLPVTPVDVSFDEELTYEDVDLVEDPSEAESSPDQVLPVSSDDRLQRQISEILESLPAKIRLTKEPTTINLNPPDFHLPTKPAPSKARQHETFPRSQSSMSNMSTRSSRAGTPSFILAPAYAKSGRPRQQTNTQGIRLYHLSRSNGEVPMKLAIRCVGENGERVMVRVGGGWADLGEYLKDYASHHSRRSGGTKVEIKDIPGSSPVSRAGSMPPTRPTSAMELTPSPDTPLVIRKSRRSTAAEEMTRALHSKQSFPKTPLAKSPMVPPLSSTGPDGTSTSPVESVRSISRASHAGGELEPGAVLGMAGPKGKNIDMAPETRAWVESVKEKVRIASGERAKSETPSIIANGKVQLGDLGKVGATKRLFRRGQTPDLRTAGSGR